MIRILLAEDDLAMRSYLARALENAGYDVVAVDRGTAALPWLERERFDLLLSDIVMPEMDGRGQPADQGYLHHRLCRRHAEGQSRGPAGQGAVQALPPARSCARSAARFRPALTGQHLIFHPLAFFFKKPLARIRNPR